MSKIVDVHAIDEHKLQIDFDDEINIVFNMKKILETIPYVRLKDTAYFQTVKFDEKAIYWETVHGESDYFPLKISIDTILFSLRE